MLTAKKKKKSSAGKKPRKEKCNVLVVGSGGREHALAWKIAQSSMVGKMFFAPGNPGTAELGTNVPIKANDIKGLLKFALANNIGLTVVGPEDPLVQGIVDKFQKAGLKIFGPNKKAAQLEGSKLFAKWFMEDNGIPTGSFKSFLNVRTCRDYLEEPPENDFPLVIKVDGLAAGKGVGVCKSRKEALDFLAEIESGKIPGANEPIIVEEFLDGEEASYIAFVDICGNFVSLDSSQDHKAVYDGDEGPNTGGMGAYSPAPVVTPKIRKIIDREIIARTIRALWEKKRIRFTGVLYAGLIIKNGQPKVLEFNVRMGDPETQPLMYRLKSDLLGLILAAVDGKLKGKKIRWDPYPAVCIVGASNGYPGAPEKGFKISGIDRAETFCAKVFHAGTARDTSGKLITAGGRVVGVTSSGRDYRTAVQNAYQAADQIVWLKLLRRNDIGYRAVEWEEGLGKAKIAIIASGSGTTADRHMKNYRRGEIEGGQIVMLISTKEGAGCIDKAKQNKIKHVVLSANKKTDIIEWNRKLREVVKAKGIDIIILAGCAKEVFPIPGVLIFNTHPADEDDHGGRHMYALYVHKHVLEKIRDEVWREVKSVEDVFYTAVTFHYAIEGMDKGSAILRASVPIPRELIRRFIAKEILLEEAAEILQKQEMQYEYAMLGSAMNMAILNWKLMQAEKK